MKILVVEDERLMADFLRRGLTAEGHVVTVVHTGNEGHAYALEAGFDMILLDWMLPDKSGLEVCEALRGAGVSTPILMLTAMDTVADRVSGLRQGADDYLIKPYAFDELVARIDALIRRRSRVRYDATVQQLVHADIIFDKETLRVTRGGHALSLTAKEIGILELLMQKPGAIVSRERILNNVWSINADPLTNIVEVYVGRLRQPLPQADC